MPGYAVFIKKNIKDGYNKIFISGQKAGAQEPDQASLCVQICMCAYVPLSKAILQIR